jgi:hypothetical protein
MAGAQADCSTADVDAVVAFLASDQRWIIGDIIHFDGAQSFDRSALSH